MAGVDEIVARLVLLGQQKFVTGMKGAADSVESVGTAQEKSAKKSKFGARGLVKWAAAAGIVYKGAQFLKSAVQTTVDLAKATAGLQRVTGMDARTASAWATTAKERGIAAQSLQRGFLTLGRQITAGSQGTLKARSRYQELAAQMNVLRSVTPKTTKEAERQKKAIAALDLRMQKARATAGTSAAMFKGMGLSMRQMTTGNTEKRLERVADALLRIKDPVQRAAAGQKLFGRAYLQLAPILSKGSKGIRENQKTIRKLGGTMDEKGVKSALEMAKTQRELNTAMTGLKVTIGTALMPTLTPLVKSFSQILVAAQPLFKLIAKNPKIVLALAAAVWALNFAMTANPVVAITVGVIALGAALYLAYKKCKPFRDIVNAVFGALKVVFGWIKGHWQLIAVLLGGPFALAAIEIAKHFSTIRKVVGAAIAFIFRVLRGVAKFVSRIVAAIGSAVSKVTGPVKTLLHAGGKVTGAVGGLAGHVGLATGGMVTQAGQVLVGERGPELLSLPAGAQVTPMSMPAQVAHGAGPSTMVAKVYLDKRVLATAVAEVGADRKARR